MAYPLEKLEMKPLPLINPAKDGAAKYRHKSTWSNTWGPNPLILLSSVFCHLRLQF
jgi:hypothetical protein